MQFCTYLEGQASRLKREFALGNPGLYRVGSKQTLEEALMAVDWLQAFMGCYLKRLPVFGSLGLVIVLNKGEDMDPNRRARIRELLAQVQQLLNEEGPQPPPPSNVVPIEREERRATGTIGRPKFSIVRDKSLFTAGLKLDDGTWLNIEAWGKTAEFAKDFASGNTVTAVGRMKSSDFVGNDGTLKHRDTLVVAYFEGNATSAVS